MTDTFRALCAELADAYLRTLEHINNSTWLGYEPSDDPLLQRARASLAQPEPGSKRRYIYNPAQIAECGGPCQQGPDHCDCGELWITEPELESHQ